MQGSKDKETCWSLEKTSPLVDQWFPESTLLPQASNLTLKDSGIIIANVAFRAVADKASAQRDL